MQLILSYISTSRDDQCFYFYSLFPTLKILSYVGHLLCSKKCRSDDELIS